MQKEGSFMQPYDMKELEERVILVGVQESFRKMWKNLWMNLQSFVRDSRGIGGRKGDPES